METMKAVRVHKYGGADVLRYEDAPRPKAGPGEVLVLVHAAGVNPVDWKVREGHLQEMMPRKFPFIPGWDVSGTVHEVGEGVSDFAFADEVYSRPDLGRDGAYAEYISVAAGELAKKPKSIDHADAAAVPLAALTAWQALFVAMPPYTSIGLQPGQTVLIHAGAGGVGHLAVQLAKWRGARVIATGSTRNEEFVRELGADEYIDYTQRRFEDVAKNVDGVLDTMAGEIQDRSWQVLRPGGTLVSILGRPSEEKARQYRVRVGSVFVQPNAKQLEEISRLIDDRVVRPHLSEVLPLEEARKAQELSQSGHTRGKIVLRVAS